MFHPTPNAYKFKYLITSITGGGVPQVYLPAQPEDDKILFKKEQKFVRPELPSHLQKEIKIWRSKVDAGIDYISPYSKQIQEWEDREWERSTTGIWFWNNGNATYITGFYHWMLSSWQMYFGFADYRETDKELTYLLQYCEEDPDCFGLLFNTIRRYGKSSVMGAWATYRTTRNYGHYCGMQGEKDDKIAKFYNQMIKKPFLKLPYYYKPTYDTSTLLTNEIKFEKTPRRGKANLEVDEQEEYLESVIDFRPSGVTEYDGSVLHTYIGEEPGKVLTCSISERWKIVKPCLRKGRQIRGKAFMGTTVEFLDVTGRGGKAYKKLFYDSDFDDKQSDGRTKSGLYACFLPGDCAYEGYFDDWGFPLRERAKAALMLEREAVKDDAKDLSDLIRKYPLSIAEIFYINTVRCEFNATILQDRRSEIDATVEPLYSKFDLAWENNVRFSKLIPRHNPTSGWLKAAWLPNDSKETNLVETRYVNGVNRYVPQNDSKIAIGFDPIDHGVIVEGRSTDSDDEFVNSRRSKPVLLVKLKYDSKVDGILDYEEMQRRAQKGKMENGLWVLDPNGRKFQYKSNRYVVMMDTRPGDPNVLYERALMICWYFGASLHVESQKPGVIRYFQEHGCGDFILNKYIPVDNKRVNPYDEGTPASPLTIHEYTSEIMTYVEYFGHTIPFRELVEDLLLFNPNKTKEYDYTVAMGFTELSCKIKPKVQAKPVMNLEDIMPIFDHRGNVIN